MNLTILRKNKNVSQKELAEFLQMSQTAISHFETGRNEPDLKTVIKLADFFNCSIDYLLGHQANNTIYLDSLTNEQKVAFELIKQLDDKQTLKVIGYIERIKDTPFEDVINNYLKKGE